jgi:hypothetical protein
MSAVEDCGHCYSCVGSKPAYEDSWLTVGMTQMIVCAECGNKRCPHSTDHRLDCTGSNEPGQEGSRYPKPTLPDPNDNRTREQRVANFFASLPADGEDES